MCTAELWNFYKIRFWSIYAFVIVPLSSSDTGAHFLKFLCLNDKSGKQLWICLLWKGSCRYKQLYCSFQSKQTAFTQMCSNYSLNSFFVKIFGWICWVKLKYSASTCPVPLLLLSSIAHSLLWFSSITHVKDDTKWVCLRTFSVYWLEEIHFYK